MLPKPYRLTRSKAIQQVLQHGKRYHGAGFSLVVFPLPVSKMPALPLKTKPFCVAFVVSKKVHKRATVRNRLRRRVRAALQTQLLLFKPELEKCWHWVVFPKLEAEHLPFEKLVQQWQVCLQKLDLLAV